MAEGDCTRTAEGEQGGDADKKDEKEAAGDSWGGVSSGEDNRPISRSNAFVAGEGQSTGVACCCFLLVSALEDIVVFVLWMLIMIIKSS